MSGLAAIWQLDGAPVEPPAFQWLLSTLSHRGIDGQSTWCGDAGSLALGHLHFWTTPEEVGERQPVARGELALMLDGRLDNRSELAAALGIAPHDVSPQSDASLALHAFERWGDELPNQLKGPFALVAWDGRRRRLLCARDPIGRRSLFYRHAVNSLSIASEPGALLGGDAAAAELDEVFLAHFYALRQAPEGRTMFTGVRELPPGHRLCVSAEGVRRERYASRPLEPVRYRTTGDYAERFNELLDRAVARRMRAPKPPAIMMSGGFDSTSVAALAARQLGAETPGRRLDVYSYVFDDLKELDEREWTAPMVAMYGLRQTTVVGDDAWPLSDYDAWTWHPSGPDIDAFRPLNERIFAAARADGQRVLLTGAAADALFIHGHEAWLADLVVDGRYAEAASELAKHVRRLGAGKVLSSPSVRRLGARLVRHAPRPLAAPSWLTASAAALIVPPEESGTIVGSSRRADDVHALLESLSGGIGIDARRGFHLARVDVRDPFTDIDLVAYMLSIPAYMLYNRGKAKFLLREAAGALLPIGVLEREQRSNLTPLFRRSMRVGSARHARLVRASPNGGCDRFVKPLRGPDSVGESSAISAGALDVVQWYCLIMTWWLAQRPSHVRAERS